MPIRVRHNKAVLVNWIRFFLFMAILAVLGVAALLYWEHSDKDIVEGLQRTAEQARREALAVGRETSTTLANTGEEVNEQGRKLRAQTEQVRERLNEAGREQRERVAEQGEVVREQAQRLQKDALTWKDKLLGGVEQAASRFRTWWNGQAAAGS